MSSMSASAESGMSKMPIWRAIAMFFRIDRPSGMITRPNDWAASASCCTRWMWLAKQAVMMRRPTCWCIRSYNTPPTAFSERECPCSSALVESLSSRRMPSPELMPPMRLRSDSRPSTGVRSILKSPECRIVPCGVWNAVAKPWGTECVIGRNSQSKGPNCRRSLSLTTMSLVFLRTPFSSMRPRARPRVNSELMIGNLNSCSA